MGSQIADAAMHETALQHFEAGRLTEAAAACEAVLHRSPRDWLALRLLGHVRNNEHAFDQAARLFTAALQAAPPDVPDEISILHGLAEALRGKQDFDGALDCYRRALARNPRDVVTLQNHGSTLVALNRHAEALKQYRLARAIAPDSPDLRLNEGISMLALGMWPEGWEQLEARLSMPHLNPVDQFPKDVPHWRGETLLRASRSCCRPNRAWAIRFSSFVTLHWWQRSARVSLSACSPHWARCWHECRLRIPCSPSPTRFRMLTCSVRS
jgi:tetratricopeptide (TPR) repeat protein